MLQVSSNKFVVLGKDLLDFYADKGDRIIIILLVLRISFE